MRVWVRIRERAYPLSPDDVAGHFQHGAHGGAQAPHRAALMITFARRVRSSGESVFSAHSRTR